ncbi:beta-ketoacyl synthase N-terminal-like domain-containing protein [Streptomyces sp. NPDC101219]|uniref:beta-ketoacyl synthase N-terminal-like domain-containing protein n=1 Tax=Streptomyces sp. NPDC101219 TaxID=3366131 RepID=UPI00381D8C93
MHDAKVQMVLLSAADEERLVRLARLYRDHLDDTRDTAGAPALADLAFTTQTGRVPLGHRLAVLCGSLAELRTALDDVVHGRPAAAARRSVVAHLATSHTADPAPVSDAQEALAVWLSGGHVDWRGLWPAPRRKVALPAYPFDDLDDPPGTSQDRGSTWEPAASDDRGSMGEPAASDDRGSMGEPAASDDRGSMGEPTASDTPRDAVPDPYSPRGADTAPSAPEAPRTPRGAAPADGGWATEYLRRVFAETAQLAVEDVRADVPLEDFGLSSFLITRLNSRLEEDLGERSRTLFFQHGTLADVAEALAARHPAPPAAGTPGEAAPGPEPAPAAAPRATAPTPAATPAPTVPARDRAEPLAVVGIAGRFPGAASLTEFWDLLRTGTCAVGPVPQDRLRPGWPTSLMHGGYLADVDRFDPLLLGITPRHAALMDPQERLCLEVVWEALDDAGYPAARLRAAHDSRVGVYVGSMYNEYPYFGVEQSLLGPPADSGSTVAGIANRVSYAFDLHGPSMTVDTMCSASLVALHLAARALRAGECEAAVVAATNLSLHPNKFRQIDRLGGASGDHLCRSFGRGGDGMVPAEAVCALLLKPLSAAEAAGDRVHALVSGTAVINAGRTNGWIVPSPTAQAEVVRQALADAGLDPSDIGYLEAHGAGTALGDPIEADGLHRIFAGDDRGRGTLPIGSVKSNIGHAEASAGLAGAAKVVLQFAHRTLVPSLHADELNPDIDWEHSPLRVQRTLQPWDTPGSAPRRAGVSSFGAGGTLAHVVLEEPPAHLAPDAPADPTPPAPTPVLLSAYDRDRLREVVTRLLAHLRDHPATDLADLAFTLAEGRHHLRERAALVVRGVGELADRLRRHLAGDPAAGVHRGRAPSDRTRAEPLAAGDPEELARQWVTGRPVRIAPPTGRRPRIVPLPAYPFARMRCWLPEPADRPDIPAASAPPVPESSHRPATRAVSASFESETSRRPAPPAAFVAPDPEPAHRPATPAVSAPPVPESSHRPASPADSAPPVPESSHWPATPATPAASASSEPVPAGPDAAAGLPLYRRTWHAAGAVTAPAGPPGALVCVYGPGSAALARAVVARAGAGQVFLIREDAAAGEAHATLSGTSGTSGAELADRALAAHPDLTAVLDLADVDRATDDPGPWQERLALLQRFAATGPGRRAAGRTRPLHVLHATRGRRTVGAEPGPRSGAGARLAGFVRFLGAESNHLTGITVDLDPAGGTPSAQAGELLAALPGNPYGEVVHRAGQAYLPRLTPLTGTRPKAPRLDHYGTYLLTGATRGIGARVARHLVDRGARHLALLGARSLPPDDRWDAPGLDAASRAAVETVRALEAAGARVHVHRGSLLDAAGLGAFLDQVREESGPVRGAVHCAAVTPPVGAFAARQRADIQRVFEPKAEALEVLYELCLPDRPDFLLAFSSLSAVVPPVAGGVLEYAAANSFVDDFTARHAPDTPWLHSVAWPMWRDSGARPGAGNPGARFGLDAAGDEEALHALDHVVTALPGGPVVALRPLHAADPTALLRLPGATAAEPAAAPAAAGPALPDRAATPVAAPAPAPSGPAGQRPVPGWLADIFAGVVGIPAADFDPTAEFAELGVESVMLGELLDAIEQHVGRALDPTLLVEHSTLRTLADRLHALLPEVAAADRTEPSDAPTTDDGSGSATAPPGSDGAPAVTVTPSTAAATPHNTSHQQPTVPQDAPAARTPAAPRLPAPEPDRDTIAVIGMACRLPGAPDVATFWRNLAAGHLAVGEVPPERWDASRFHRPTPQPGRTVGKWGGFVDGIEEFDAGHFGLTDEQARCLDPTIRLFLETTADCLRDAGLEGPELAGRDVGLFAGARGTDYAARGGIRAEVPESDPNFVASHVGQHFDLRGPHLVVDSACSSSLVAVHLACQSLRSGESEAAIAGGSSVLLDESPYLEFSAAGALSPTGRCAAFDRRADGFVPGEGSVVLLLKPLHAALRDGDPVHGVIEGSAVTNDGRTMGLTTPNPAAQAAAVRRALRDAGRKPAEVGMIEAHGTGTAIGDPLEFRALRTVFDEDRDHRDGPCLLGSVKTNVGHLLHAAGAAGLLKALLAVRHGTVPPTLHCETPNPRLDLDDSPFALAAEARDWPLPGRPRVAGVSSFGFGGTNAHVVVAEAPPAQLDAAGERRRSRPPIAFDRRRLWLDRPGGPSASDGPSASGGPSAPDGPSASDGPSADGPVSRPALRLAFR